MSGSLRKQAHGEPARHPCPRSGDQRRVLGGHGRVAALELARRGAVGPESRADRVPRLSLRLVFTDD